MARSPNRSAAGHVAHDAASRQYKLNHPEKNREWKRRSYKRNSEQVRYYWINRKYGLSREAYDAKVRAQENRCAICGTDFSEFTRRPAIDHDHATGKVRDLLCNTCNVRVGVVEGEANWRPGVLAYIERHKKAG